MLGRKRHPLVRCVSSYAIGAIVSVTAVSIVAYSYGLLVRGSRRLYVGWFSSAGFVLLTVSISLRLIILHLINWNAPHIQKYVVRIVWMVPIYAAESWMALRFKNSAVYIESMRESYESYAIFSFLHFLIALLGEEHQLVSKLKLKTADRGAHAWPISELLSPWAMGHDLLQNCKFGVFQYVIIKNIFAVLICASAGSDWYREGHFRLDGLYLYQCLICNISQLWALYCLVLFYFATKEELSPWRPHGKFLSVKSVVFFTWWQSVLINALAKPAWTSDGEWTSQQVSKGVQVRSTAPRSVIDSQCLTVTLLDGCRPHSTRTTPSAWRCSSHRLYSATHSLTKITSASVRYALATILLFVSRSYKKT